MANRDIAFTMHLFFILYYLSAVFQYIPPIDGSTAGAADAGSLMSATSDSVVSTIDATDAAFWSAERVTFVGSTIPLSIMSAYSSVRALKP